VSGAAFFYGDGDGDGDRSFECLLYNEGEVDIVLGD
jgi:hypothetical protein